MDWDSIAFNSSAFIAGLFLLEFGADVFIDNTAIVARRLGISETLVALLTAGAEWEELAVVVAAILQNRSSLGLGNVIGSSISNILGAFSLGLLCHHGTMTFDRSAKIYTGVLFVVTTIFTIIAFTGRLGQLAGILSLVAFVIYITSIGYGIYKGVLDAPEDDSDGSDDSDEEEIQRSRPSEASPLLANDHMSSSSTEELTQGIPASPSSTKRQHSLLYHIGRLLLGFIALSLSGYVLSHAASSLATALYLSDTVVGITILSFATTLPEKLLSVLSGMRGHGGIVVASTAGSNIFLLTLCLGVIFVADGGKKHLVESILGFEIWSAWACSVLLMAIVWTGGNRVVGGLMLMLYIAFIVLEFTRFRR